MQAQCTKQWKALCMGDRQVGVGDRELPGHDSEVRENLQSIATGTWFGSAGYQPSFLEAAPERDDFLVIAESAGYDVAFDSS